MENVFLTSNPDWAISAAVDKFLHRTDYRRPDDPILSPSSIP